MLYKRGNKNNQRLSALNMFLDVRSFSELERVVFIFNPSITSEFSPLPVTLFHFIDVPLADED